MKKGFTLIELLVVVLIIGILAAVAFPQYQVAVNKAKFMDAVMRVKSLADAQEIYYMANGKYSQDHTALDINVVSKTPGGSGNLFCLGAGCYILVLNASSSQGKGAYAYFAPRDGQVPFMYYGYKHSAVNAGRRICCFFKNQTIQSRICRGFGGKKAEDPNQGSGMDCYYF